MPSTATPGPTRFDAGHVTLHSYRSLFTPLEELQAVAESDGGVLHVDADGTLVYRDRSWITGRPDQTDIPTFSDNYCASPVSSRGMSEMTTDDDVLVNDVTLTNVAAVSVHAENRRRSTGLGRLSLPSQRFRDQWIDATTGQAWPPTSRPRSNAYLRVEQFALYLNDAAQDLWRIGDRPPARRHRDVATRTGNPDRDRPASLSTSPSSRSSTTSPRTLG